MSSSSFSPAIVSSCLLGMCTTWRGDHCRVGWIEAAAKEGLIVPVCPEQLGGLSTPRPPMERRGERVVNSEGDDVTAQMDRGAEATLRIAREHGATLAILKSRSPSCGKGEIYDGSFSGAMTEGNGVTTELLTANGITVMTEEEIHSVDQLRELIGVNPPSPGKSPA